MQAWKDKWQKHPENHYVELRKVKRRGAVN